MRTALSIVVLLVTMLAVTLLAKKPAKPNPPPPGPVAWTKQASVSGSNGAYTPVVLIGGSNIRVFVNVTPSGTGAGTWWRRDGSWSSLGSASVALSPSQAYDQVGTPYYRTSGVARGASGTYYAVVHIGDGYPSSTGFRPAWATSPNGVTWTYHGKFAIDGVAEPYVLSSSAALVVQEEKPAVLDTSNPINNRFLNWQDSYCFGSTCRRLLLLYSADGRDWRTARAPDGSIAEAWPATLSSDSPVFETASKGWGGRFHLIVGNRWPVSALRHLYSCNGLQWRVLDANSPVRNTGSDKGANLAYDLATSTLHALSSGQHWSVVDGGFACP